MEYPKQGETVLYSTQGITHKAIVLHVHFGQVEHLGKNGEPLLHLAFIAPERESEFVRRKSNFLPSIFTEFDVVHHSQEFSDGFKRNNGLSTPAQIAVHRGQGEWRKLIEPRGFASGDDCLGEIRPRCESGEFLPVNVPPGKALAEVIEEFENRPRPLDLAGEANSEPTGDTNV